MKPQHWQLWKGERLCTWNKSNCGIYLILCPGFKHTDTWPQCTYPCHCMGLQDHCEHRPRRKSYLHIWKMTRIRRWYEHKNNYRDHNWSTLPICAFMALNTFIKYTYLVHQKSFSDKLKATLLQLILQAKSFYFFNFYKRSNIFLGFCNVLKWSKL